METIVDGSVTELTTAELEQQAAVRRAALWIFNDLKKRNAAEDFDAGQDEHLIALTDEVLDLEARAAKLREEAAQRRAEQTVEIVPPGTGRPAAEPEAAVAPAETGHPEVESAAEAGQPQVGHPVAGQPATGSAAVDVTPGPEPVTEVGRPEVGRPEVGQPEVGQREVGQREVGRPEVGQREVGQREVGRLGAEETEHEQADEIGQDRPINLALLVLACSAALVPLVGLVIGRTHVWGLVGFFVAIAVAAGLLYVHRRAGRRGYPTRVAAARTAAVAGVGLAVVALFPFQAWVCLIPLTLMVAALVAAVVSGGGDR